MTKHRQEKHRLVRRTAADPAAPDEEHDEGQPHDHREDQREARAEAPTQEPAHAAPAAPAAESPVESPVEPVALAQVRPPTVAGKRRGEPAPQVEDPVLPAPRTPTMESVPGAPSAAADPFDVPAASYGSDKPRATGTVVVIAGVVGALFLAWLAWAAIFHSTPEVASRLTAFEFRGATTALATVEVDLDEALGADCVVQAIAEDHTVVGEQHFAPVQGVNTVVIRTERQATSVALVGCTAQGQERPR